MDHRIPKVGIAISLFLAVLAAITFVFLNQRFQGPNPVGFLQSPFTLTARFADNKTLPTKQAVLYHGVAVGTVTGVKWDPGRRESEVKFTLKDGFRLRKDAVIRIGYRSLLGDPYLAVDNRGSDSQPELRSGDEVQHTTTTVDFDEALSFLDKEGREHVRSLIRTVADATAAPGNGERLNGTLGGVSRTVSELHTLTKTVHGQEDQIASLVKSSSTVLSTLGSREDAIRNIVSSGRTTLDALASNSASLEQGIAELPRLLSSGRASLAELRPLLVQARPVFTKLRKVAPALSSALDPKAQYPLSRTVGNLIAVIQGLEPLNKQATPVLKRLRVLLDELVPVVQAGGPAARTLVPSLDYLTPRSKAIATGYALLAATLKASDSTSRYARVGLGLDPNEVNDSAPDPNHNAYPGPGDATNPQRFTGTYPRITPCTVPSRKTPKEPCK